MEQERPILVTSKNTDNKTVGQFFYRFFAGVIGGLFLFLPYSAFTAAHFNSDLYWSLFHISVAYFGFCLLVFALGGKQWLYRFFPKIQTSSGMREVSVRICNFFSRLLAGIVCIPLCVGGYNMVFVEHVFFGEGRYGAVMIPFLVYFVIAMAAYALGGQSWLRKVAPGLAEEDKGKQPVPFPTKSDQD